MTFKFVENILPQELLQEITELCETFTYVKNSRTVHINDECDKFIDTIDFIQEIPVLVHSHYYHYNEIYDKNFTSDISIQIYNAFRYYMPEEFENFKLKRFYTNKTIKNKDYPENKTTTPHYDSPDEDGEYKTILFYVNSSDGDTIVYNETGDYSIWQKDSEKNISNMKLTVAKKQKPTKNCALIYSSDTLHCMRPPKESLNRYIFNFVLQKT